MRSRDIARLRGEEAAQTVPSSVPKGASERALSGQCQAQELSELLTGPAPVSAYPHGGQIQTSFGRHRLGGVEARIGGEAAVSCDALGAAAYTAGNRVAFKSSPSAFLAAHEAAHVVQQQRGVNLPGGRGRSGDAYERHADAVAHRVVKGLPAESLLDAMPASGGSQEAVQLAEAFVDGATASDVQQGSLGDCYLIAALGAVAHADSALIETLVTPISETQFKATLYDPKTGDALSAVVDVATLPINGEKLMYARSTQPTEFWVAILENAFVQLFGQGVYENIADGQAHRALAILTGGETSVQSVDANIIGKMMRGRRSKHPMVAASREAEYVREGDIVPGHGYVVLACGRDGTVTLKNTWATDEETKGDVFELTEQEFRMYFDHVAFSDPSQRIVEENFDELFNW